MYVNCTRNMVVYFSFTWLINFWTHWFSLWALVGSMANVSMQLADIFRCPHRPFTSVQPKLAQLWFVKYFSDHKQKQECFWCQNAVSYVQAACPKTLINYYHTHLIIKQGPDNIAISIKRYLHCPLLEQMQGWCSFERLWSVLHTNKHRRSAFPPQQ